MASSKVRLFVDHPLAPGQSVALSREQAHYLFGVMRLARGDTLAIFNGRDGEYRAAVVDTGKRGGMLQAETQTRALQEPPDLWMLFAPVKKARTDSIVEKATEMGAARILPVQTQFTNSERIRRDRLQAHAVEAAEQCGGTFVPKVGDLKKLDTVLGAWPAGRRLLYCDEALAGERSTLQATTPDACWAILIGPEGGFSDAERSALAALPFVTRISLGPRILRADTAVVAAMALWQSVLGDW